jgi:hypothetical protein
MVSILTPFMYLAGFGLVLSLIVHASTFFGVSSPLGELTWSLHIGLFIVWFPAVIVANRLAKDFKQKDFWKAVLRACPRWMKSLTFFFFVYAIINFTLWVILDIGGGFAKGSGSKTPPNVLKGFSGHWMAFYSAAMAILYSAIHVTERDATRRCPTGHPVSPSAKFCEECGLKITEPLDRTPPRN